MIKKPSNWENVQAFSDRQKLPLGTYVCKVLNALVASTQHGGQMLQLSFDIADGEYKDFYKRDYNASTLQNKKWRGVLRVWLPVDDGSEKDENAKRALKGAITSFEKSNPGYTWNWDEKSLVGKSVGIMMRNEEWEYNGKRGWAVRPFRAISVDSVINGDYTLPNDKPLNGDAYEQPAYNAPATPAPQAEFMVVETDDSLPF